MAMVQLWRILLCQEQSQTELWSIWLRWDHISTVQFVGNSIQLPLTPVYSMYTFKLLSALVLGTRLLICWSVWYNWYSWVICVNFRLYCTSCVCMRSVNISYNFVAVVAALRCRSMRITLDYICAEFCYSTKHCNALCSICYVISVYQSICHTRGLPKQITI